MAPRKRLGALLIEMGVIDEHQLNSALGHQKQWGGKLGSVLVQKGLCKEADVVRVLSVHLGMPIIHLASAQIDPRVLKLVSKQVAEKLRVFPVELNGQGRGETLTIAMAEPSDLSVVDQIAFHTGKRVKPVLTGESEIATSIALHYRDSGKGQEAQTVPTPISSQRYTNSGPNVTGRVAPTSSRPPPPQIAPPIMAPVPRPASAMTTTPFGQQRTSPSQPSLQRIRPPSQPSFPVPPPYTPPPIPIRPPPQPALAAQQPLEEIEPLDIESIPGMQTVPGSPPPVHEEPISWDEAPPSDPGPGWDEAEPAPEPEPAPPTATQPGVHPDVRVGGRISIDNAITVPSPVPQEIAWGEAELSEPGIPEAEAELTTAEIAEDKPFGEARDWSDEGTPRSDPADAPRETTDELPADAILGTADAEGGEPPAEPPAEDPFFAAPASEAAEAPAAETQASTPSFFEAPVEETPAPAAALAEPAAAVPAESAPPAEAAAPEAPPAPVPPLVDPWADMVIPSGDEAPSAFVSSAEEAVDAHTLLESDHNLSASSAGIARAADIFASPPPGAEEIAAQFASVGGVQIGESAPGETAAAAPEEPATSEPAASAAPETSAVVAPDAWAEVADPLGSDGEPVAAQPGAPEPDAPEAPAPAEAAAPADVPATYEQPESIFASAEETSAAQAFAPETEPPAAEPAADGWDHPVEAADPNAVVDTSAWDELPEDAPPEAPLAAEAPADEAPAAEAAAPEAAADEEPAEAPAATALSTDPGFDEMEVETDVNFTSDEFEPLDPGLVGGEAQPVHDTDHDIASPFAQAAAADAEEAFEQEWPDAAPDTASPTAADVAAWSETHPGQEEPAQEEGAGWLGQALAETTPLSHYDVETLAGVGISPSDSMGAMRLLAALLRQLHDRQVIDLGELTVDLYQQRVDGASGAALEEHPPEQPAGEPASEPAAEPESV